MKITPLEIRQKSFERNLRGYDKDEVSAFLNSLSQEWERTLDEMKEIRLRLEHSEREVGKLREVETTLYKTLKTAEDTGANVVEQANRQAELHLRETQLQVDAMLAEARGKARQIIEESERRSHQIMGDLEQRLRETLQSYREAMQHRDALSGDLARMAQELGDRAERLRRSNEGFQPEALLAAARRETPPASEVPVIPPKVSKPDAAPEQPAKPNQERSFFDGIS